MAFAHMSFTRSKTSPFSSYIRSTVTQKFTIKEKKHLSLSRQLSFNPTNFFHPLFFYCISRPQPWLHVVPFGQIVPQLWHRSFNVRKSRERSPRVWQRSFYYAFVTTFCPSLVAHSPRDCFSFPRFFSSCYRTIFFVNARSFTGVNFSSETWIKSLMERRWNSCQRFRCSITWRRNDHRSVISEIFDKWS